MKTFTSWRKPLTAFLPALAMTAQAQTERPNILVFLVDDMGWQETSLPFWSEETALNRRYRTPNMQRLAEQGVKFTSAYSCPVSTPSRSSLLSGMNAARHGVTNWIEGLNQNTNASGSSIDLPEWNWNGVQPAGNATAESLTHCQLITALPQVLKDNGYYTIHCGKANFGSKHTPGADPVNFGFDVNVAGTSYGSPGSYLASDNYGLASNKANYVQGLDEYAKQGYFLTEALTLEAMKQLDQRPADKPFYLYFAHYAIHTPYNADSRFTGNYRMSNGTGIFDEQLQANLNSNEVNHAALIEGMDKSLGDIMDYLEQKDLAKNTIIIFMSDNGGQSVSVRQGKENIDQNYPSRGGKGSCYDGGVHEPMIVRWPGYTETAATCRSRVMIEDFYPSILEMAGVTDYQTVQTIDGRSFADLVKDPSIERDRTTIFHYPNRWGENFDKAYGFGSWSAIMKGDYHLLYFWEGHELRLFNLKEDISEANDLALTEHEVLMDLAQTLTDSLRNMKACIPTKNGLPIMWPVEAAARIDKEIRSGESYTIQPYNDPSKFAYAVSTAKWGTTSGAKKVFYTDSPSLENGAFWTFTAKDAGFTIQPSGEGYAKTQFLNPKLNASPGYIGTYTADKDYNVWELSEVGSEESLYVLDSKKTTHCYFLYDANDQNLKFEKGKDLVPTAQNWFYIRKYTECVGIADITAPRQVTHVMVDLQGRSVSRMGRGVYIVDGKKIVK